MRRLILAIMLSIPACTAGAEPLDQRVAALRERAIFDRFAKTLEQRGEPRALLLAAQLVAGDVRYDAHNERRGGPLSMPLAERLERQRRADALIGRVWEAASRDALVLYELVAECPGTPAACRSDEALAALRSNEADNAFA